MSQTPSERVSVSLGQRSYEILIEPDALRARELREACAGRGCLLVTDQTVGALYAERILAGLDLPSSHCLSLPPGEQHKHLGSFETIVTRMAELGLRRDGCLIALGGGVVGDLAGFAAAAYMRGVDFVQCPTTLLAMVDSSVGGKTGLNLPSGKNLVGAFWQPQLVLADIEVLSTLSDREYRAGLAEVIKYAAIGDAGFFDWLEQQVEQINARDTQTIAQMVAISCRHKAAIVARDEREAGERALLNFGHTFGHALEAGTDYRTLLHGEAVAIGMLQAARLSSAMGMAPQQDAERLSQLLRAVKLPVDPPRLPLQRLHHHLALDKKAVAGGLKFILWRGIGQAEIVRGVDQRALDAVLQSQQ
ncbi:MAG: 3-dehydroquinate synthase [Xanthomonadales bacterium]|nr:3-dehydroquinate synthase [Xanthomonadales bacterium]